MNFSTSLLVPVFNSPLYSFFMFKELVFDTHAVHISKSV